MVIGEYFVLNHPLLSLVNILFLIILFLATSSSLAIDVVFNSFTSNDLIFTGDARVDSSIIRLTSNSNDYSMGRAFYPHPFSYKTNGSASTSFVFSILPEITSSPGFGFAFVYTNSTVPSGALASQYFGIFTNSTEPSVAGPAPLLVIEFDVGRNPEFNDTDGNHIGINLNTPESFATEKAGYYNSTTGEFVPVDMRSGKNIQAWIEFDGKNFRVNVTIAPVGVPKPSKPLISTSDPSKADFVSNTMFVGFSASKTAWKEEQRILAWSLSDEGFARDINTSNLPVFTEDHSSVFRNPLSNSVIAAIVVSLILVPAILLFIIWRFWFKKRRGKVDEEDEKIQEWELEYWPHRFSYQELNEATNGFSKNMLLGSGGFGKVYKGILPNNIEIAVKCVNHDSKQGLKEFMAEISSIGRLQHKNLIHLRGWCKKGQQLMLVYDFMPSGSLSSWIFSKSENNLEWKKRRRVLVDVAEALNYLHHGWHQLVLHRDIKSGNILLDSSMRGRLGDFGLAKLYKQEQDSSTTRLVGTIGYMAPELVLSGPSTASDVFSFGIVILEIISGRRPIEGEVMLLEWAKELLVEGRLCDCVDKRIAGECEESDVEMVLNLGLACCDSDPQLRPTMKEVCGILINSNTLDSDDNYVINELEMGFNSGNGSVISKVSFISDLSPRT